MLPRPQPEERRQADTLLPRFAPPRSRCCSCLACLPPRQWVAVVVVVHPAVGLGMLCPVGSPVPGLADRPNIVRALWVQVFAANVPLTFNVYKQKFIPQCQEHRLVLERRHWWCGCDDEQPVPWCGWGPPSLQAGGRGGDCCAFSALSHVAGGPQHGLSPVWRVSGSARTPPSGHIEPTPAAGADGRNTETCRFQASVSKGHAT